MTIRDLVREAHALAVVKGWHDTPRTPGECIALMHSELSEALEEVRKGKSVSEIYYEPGCDKPEGVPVELADVVIRIADFCGLHGIDLEAAIVIKHTYNRSRSHRHGGKVL